VDVILVMAHDKLHAELNQALYGTGIVIVKLPRCDSELMTRVCAGCMCTRGWLCASHPPARQAAGCVAVCASGGWHKSFQAPPLTVHALIFACRSGGVVQRDSKYRKLTRWGSNMTSHATNNTFLPPVHDRCQASFASLDVISVRYEYACRDVLYGPYRRMRRIHQYFYGRSQGPGQSVAYKNSTTRRSTHTSSWGQDPDTYKAKLSNTVLACGLCLNVLQGCLCRLRQVPWSCCLTR
jgi:hypothetical protein